jgi:myosin heavy subunit
MLSNELSRAKSKKFKAGGKGGAKQPKKEANTVSASFRSSLGMLMTKMGQCDPHFVRCIKPNPTKQARVWDQAMVLQQLTYTGMLQTVKMRREGYPFRISFVEFFNSYHGIVMDFSSPVRGTQQSCKELLTKLEAHVEGIRVGGRLCFSWPRWRVL